MISQDQLFNEYYFDFLKKLKTYARAAKHDSHNARVILRGIKKHYASYDKESPEYRKALNSASDVWDSYNGVEESVDALEAWVSEHSTAELYKDIPLECIHSEFSDPFMFHHFLTVINMTRQPISEANLEKVIQFCNTSNNVSTEVELVDDSDDVLKHNMQRIKYLTGKRTEKSMKDKINSIPNIEDTSLGKLAKEIMEDMNIEELQKSFGEGDIMQALANPDGGLIKILGTVSQKMISKMSSGELKQENLLQDAMKLASQLGGGAGDLGQIGKIASMFAGNSAGGFDLNKMMGAMMGGGNAGPSRPKVRPNMSNIKKLSKQQDLRMKLREKKQAKENMQGDVGSDE